MTDISVVIEQIEITVQVERAVFATYGDETLNQILWNENNHASGLGSYDKLTDTITFGNVIANNLYSITEIQAMDFFGIETQDITNRDSAFSLAHSHSNKLTLDGITNTLISNRNSAYSLAHSHTNKTILDAIDTTAVSNRNSAYSHISNTSNPHSVTKTQVGLSDVDNLKQIPWSYLGNPLGVATLDAGGKVPLTQINDVLFGQVQFQTLWNANTNTPTLPNPATSKGFYYIVSTGGTQFGIDFLTGDWCISDGTNRGKVDNTDAVTSVFGRTAGVTAQSGDYDADKITETLTRVFVSPTEKSTWNGKQDALGFTPEDESNKENTTMDSSTDKYPTNRLAKEYTDRLNPGCFGITLDGQGGVLSNGSKGFVTIPYGATITHFYITGDVSGSIVVDIKRGGVSIVGAGNFPRLSSQQRLNEAVASRTSDDIVANDELEFVVTGTPLILSRINLFIFVSKT